MNEMRRNKDAMKILDGIHKKHFLDGFLEAEYHLNSFYNFFYELFKISKSH